MESYFYCSYENSSAGFFHARLRGDELVPVEGGHEGLPEPLGEFFSYGLFRLLWRDLAEPVEKPWQQPRPTAAMFGLRELEGSFSDGRRGTVNLAFYAQPGEESRLRRTALAVLGDFEGFCARLFGWLSAGGPCGYSLDGAAFNGWVEDCAGRSCLRLLVPSGDPAAALLPGMQRQQPPKLERGLLRLAVCTGGWKDTAPALGGGPNWLLKPACALTQADFEEMFTGRGPIWELEPGA